MQELLSLVLGQLRSIWRFRWVALGIAWVVALVGWLYVYSVPDQYRSSARVHINTQSALGPLLGSMAYTPNAEQQARLLINTVLSRPNLQDVARMSGLALEAVSPEQEQALIDRLQSRLSLRGGGRSDLYTIEYTSPDPQRAQSVVQSVMSVMTSMSLMDDDQDNSKHAVAFLQKKVDKYAQELDDIQQQLLQFTKGHAELMPGSADYVTQVQRLNTRIASIQTRLEVARSRKSSIIRNMGSGGDTSVSPARSKQVQTIDAQIAAAEQQLSQLRLRYTPKHPDVIFAKRRIEELEQQRSDTLARLRAHPGEIQAASSTSSGGGGGELVGINMEIQTLELSLKRERAELAKLRSNAVPMNTAQARLAEIKRDYKVTQEQYQKLLSRLYSAQLSVSVQDTSPALEFRVVDPPLLPRKPVGPKRVIMMFMALFGAVVAGLAFAWFLAQIRPVFASRRDLTEATGLPVIGSLGLALSPVQVAGRRISKLVFAVCGMSLLVGFAAALFFMPIGVQWVPKIVSGLVL